MISVIKQILDARDKGNNNIQIDSDKKKKLKSILKKKTKKLDGSDSNEDDKDDNDDDFLDDLLNGILDDDFINITSEEDKKNIIEIYKN